MSEMPAGQLTIGSATITRITEKERWTFTAAELFPAITDAELSDAQERLGPAYVDPGSGELILSIHNYVIQLGEQIVLVDTGNGNAKERPYLLAHHHFDTDYLTKFAHAGFDPAMVHLVVNTHLHPDHCGWNTRLADGQWVPTFPNATHMFFDEELNFVESIAAAGEREGPMADLARMYDDSVRPVLHHARHGALTSEHVLAAWEGTEIVALRAPGHTPGHAVIEIRGPGRALISGDVIHHPLQLALPQLSQAGDNDPELARHTRDALLARCADDRIALLPAHFSGPWPVFITRDASGQLTWNSVDDDHTPRY